MRHDEPKPIIAVLAGIACLSLAAAPAAAQVVQLQCAYPNNNPVSALVTINYGARTLRVTYVDQAGNRHGDYEFPAQIDEEKIVAVGENGGRRFTLNRFSGVLTSVGCAYWDLSRCNTNQTEPCRPYQQPKRRF